jgi:hypothetical protein
VIEEVRRGVDYRKAQKRPVILPIRLAAKVAMPYDVGAKLNRLQHLKWLTDGDETLIAEKLQEVMSTGQAPPEAPELEQDKAAALSADGLPSPAKDQLACPLGSV